MNPMDQLFRNKLTGHVIKPEVSAWNRIEKNIAKKNNGWKTWLRAASVLLIVGASVIVWKLTNNKPTENQQPSITANDTVAEPTDKNKQDTEVIVNEKPVVADVSPKRDSKKKNTAEPKALAKNNTVASVVADKDARSTPIAEENKLVAEVVETQSPLMIEEPQENKSRLADNDVAMVVVYTLEMPSNIDEAPKEKKSGLKRVLDLAREARSTENPIGELRQAKDELLAFDFGREKEKRNNR